MRCRDQHATLPDLSPTLGRRRSPNGNLLTPDRYRYGDPVMQGTGPTISGGLEFMDGSVAGQRFYVEDDGLPIVLYDALTARRGSALWRPLRWPLRRHLGRGLREKNPARNVMVWLGRHRRRRR